MSAMPIMIFGAQRVIHPILPALHAIPSASDCKEVGIFILASIQDRNLYPRLGHGFSALGDDLTIDG
jgi:hypothetical protein